MRRLVVDGDATDAVNETIARLSQDHQSVLAPSLEAQARALGLALPSNPVRQADPRDSYAQRSMVVRRAELYVEGDTLYALMHRLRSSGVRRFMDPATGGVRAEQEDEASVVTLYAIGPELDPPALAAFEATCADVFDRPLEPFHYASQRFDELLAETREAAEQPSAEDIAASEALRDRGIRTLATAIKSSSGLLLGDAPRQVAPDERERMDSIIETLQKVGLVATEAVVVCKKTNSQVNRLPDASLIEELDKSGVRCSCGRKLSDERCEEALGITERGRSLLDGNRWFTVALVQELLQLGVPLNSILVEQQAGGDEMDAIVLIFGKVFLFELKDKPFNLGSAYSFGAKIGIIRPDESVIVTTDTVGNDVRDHFERARAATGERRARYGYPEESEGAAPVYVEGIGNLRPELERFVSEASASSASNILRDVMPLGSVSVLDVMSRWATS
ncbi:MAG: hypothetical protein QOG53_422 [Frankiales bacterium]|jgi:hypothetical protein|nr:hypothetical protein [Frankiales bacterium]